MAKVSEKKSPTPSSLPAGQAGSPSGRGRDVALPVRTLEKGLTKETMPAPAFFAEAPATLIARTIHTTHARMRIRRAHTKERAEVRGGGRKPWKQKGTGRSRHGSTRSPLWVGGGTTFGPRSRKTRIPKIQWKIRRRALAGAFAMHVQNGSMSIVRLADTLPAKTKDVAKGLRETSSVLVIIDASHAEVRKALRNVPAVKVRNAAMVLPKEILESREVWIDEAALDMLSTRCTIS